MFGNRGRPLSFVLAAMVVAAASTGSAGAGTSARHAGGSSAELQPLLTLDRGVFARTGPSSAAPPLGRIAARTPLTGSEVVLPVVRTTVGPGGGNWLRVRLPRRPNGATGWVPASAGRLGSTPWRIVVHRRARRAVVFEGAKRRAVFPIVVGTPSTPTPLGTFFVVEMLHLAPGVAEGPWALATSAYSNVLQEYDGGPGQVALHGTVGLSDPLGTFSSHGCVRFAPAAITWIARHVDQGTPVVVTR
jgi:lipoprotein-anchoring transpeptidase ErfK/SrfK